MCCLLPGATGPVLWGGRVCRWASARAVELGAIVGVSNLTGGTQSSLIDENVGRTAVYYPSQASFRNEPRWSEGQVIDRGIQKQRLVIDKRALDVMRRIRQETNPALLTSMPVFEVVSPACCPPCSAKEGTECSCPLYTSDPAQQ